MSFCFTGITIVEQHHGPNEGRDIWNENFKNVGCAISSLTLSANTGSTIVVSGDDNIVVAISGVSTPPVYGVSLSDDIIVNSLSSSTISADTYYIGSVPLTGFTSGVTYTNLTPTTATVGGIEAGSTFNNVTMQYLWDTLLYPFQVPTFSAFAINGQSTTIEVGDAVPSGSTLFTWTTTNSSNVSANTLSIEDVTNVVTLGTGLANDSSENLPLPSDVIKTTATSNVWRINGVDTESGTFNRTFTVNWRWRVHYGTSSATTVTASEITGLTSSSLSSGYAGTWSFGAGDYKYFTYPSLMGTATTFKDSLTNLDVPMETVYVVSVTNAYGITTNYNVHRTTNILGSSINIIIS